MGSSQYTPSVAFIDESICIGCTKCIQACPVDAIVGTHKKMHTVIAAECTGCELCLPPCPVDCISLISLSLPEVEKTKRHQQADYRSAFRQARLERDRSEKALSHESANPLNNADQASLLVERRLNIQAAIAREKARKAARFGNTSYDS